MSIKSKANSALTPRQIKTLNELIAIGLQRPTEKQGLIEELYIKIKEETSDVLTKWTSKNFYLTKSQLTGALQCEGLVVARASEVASTFSIPALVGTFTHAAIQLAYTHPNRSIDEYVKHAIIGVRSNNEKVDSWWSEREIGEQSDIIVQVNSKLINFLDDWPKIDSKWNPRFEETINAKIGNLTLSGRADLVVGRPRTDGKQTLLIVDLKTGSLKEEHETEAMFYALAAAIRYGVTPWRSTVYSLSSGEWSEPEVTEEKLYSISEKVIKAVNSTISVLTESKPALLTPGDHCLWCPAKKTCVSAQR
jgi:hypothetical protein